MAETKHVDGPWKVTATTGRANALITDAGGQPVAYCFRANFRPNDAAANAQLIAAAPDLLRALQSYLAAFDGYAPPRKRWENIRAMRDAVAKAAGGELQ